MFAATGRERDRVTGDYVQWVAHEAVPRLVDAAVLRFPIQTAEDEVTKGLAARYRLDSDGEDQP